MKKSLPRKAEQEEPDISVESWAPRLARSILRNSLQLKKDETLTIEAWTRAIPWLDALLVEARRIGAQPMVIYDSDEAYWASISEGKEKALGKVGAQEWAALKATQAYVFFWGPSDRARFHALADKTLNELTAYEKDWFDLAKEKKFRWCRVELTRATEALAAEYGIDYRDWVKELLEGSTVDPSTMYEEGRKIAKQFSSGKQVSIKHSNGTRLELRLKGRTPFIDDGIVTEEDARSGFGMTNVPAGLVMVAVDEAFAEGRIRANRPSRYGPGKGLGEGGEWTFQNGRLVKYNFRKGLDKFERDFLKAGPTRETPAILSIGLNPKLHDSPLFEDQERGVVAIYLGTNDWLGGSNTADSHEGEYHSWLLLRGADVTVDGHRVLKAGKIV